MKSNQKWINKIVIVLLTSVLLFTTIEPSIVFATESKDTSSTIGSSEIETDTIDSSELDSSTAESNESEATTIVPNEGNTDTVESSESETITDEPSKTIESGKSETSTVDPNKTDTAESSEPNTSTTDSIELEKETMDSSKSETITHDSENYSDEEIFSLEKNREYAIELMEKESNQTVSNFARVMSVPVDKAFIDKIAPYAVEVANKYGLFPSVMIAQAALESGWGTSTLAKSPNNNLFGVKGTYNGKSVSMPTQEWSEKDKKFYTIKQNFSKYPSFLESLTDYAKKLKNGLTFQKDNYSGTWRANAKNYKEGAAGLLKPVAKYSYATDPTYVQKVTSIIETYDLDKYDNYPSVSYETHFQTSGWLKSKSNGLTSGSTSNKKRLEAIKINISGFEDLGIKYSSHVQNIGWTNWVSDGIVSGSLGEYQRLEAIKIQLTGKQASAFDVYYRVNVDGDGWLGWAKNGNISGTVDYRKKINAIQIKVLPKGSIAPGSLDNAYKLKPADISYSTHVQKNGWQKKVLNGNTSGTAGQKKRLEAIKILKNDSKYSGSIQYKSHVQNIGWQGWVENGVLSGTTGKSKRLEAIQIKLTGELAEKFDIYYRVHSQSYGWLGWAKNGSSAGSQGKSKRMEAIQIQLVQKGGKAPGSTANSFIK